MAATEKDRDLLLVTQHAAVPSIHDFITIFELEYCVLIVSYLYKIHPIGYQHSRGFYLK